MRNLILLTTQFRVTIEFSFGKSNNKPYNTYMYSISKFTEYDMKYAFALSD